MTKVEYIDSLFEKMKSNPLSYILPLVYNLALEFGDYNGFAVLWYWEKPLFEHKVANNEQRTGLIKTLLAKGLTVEEIARIERDAFEHYLSLRYVNDDNVCSYSARELENAITRHGDMLKAIEVPNGLHPVDLYFRSEKVESEKLKILQSKEMIEKQYTILQSTLLTQLTYYRSLAISEERKTEMAKGIANSNYVFIIHGHSEAKLRELKELVTGFKLQPVILNEQPNHGMTVIEKFEEYASKCAYAFALFTPDDIVEGTDGNQYFQARPNVIFELGWFYSHLGRSRVCILSQASEKNKIFSDLQGVMRIQFNKDISESYLPIKTELQSVGLV